jgi:hypothetical protein
LPKRASHTLRGGVTASQLETNLCGMKIKELKSTGIKNNTPIICKSIEYSAKMSTSLMILLPMWKRS